MGAATDRAAYPGGIACSYVARQENPHRVAPLFWICHAAQARRVAPLEGARGPVRGSTPSAGPLKGGDPTRGESSDYRTGEVINARLQPDTPRCRIERKQ